MSRLARSFRDDGWFLTAQLVTATAFRRLRNRSIAGKLGTSNFHCGHAPRLLGLAHMRIGRNFHGGDHLWLHAITTYEGQAHTPELVIEDDVTFSDNVHIACLNQITLGAGALFGSRIIVSDHAHGIYRGEQQSPPDMAPALRPLASNAPVTIGRNVWLGDGVAVLAGAQIGDGAVIGANSVVIGTIDAGTMAVGSPARPIRRWDAATNEWLAIRP